MSEQVKGFVVKGAGGYYGNSYGAPGCTRPAARATCFQADERDVAESVAQAFGATVVPVTSWNAATWAK